jgi:hypothetical protein
MPSGNQMYIKWYPAYSKVVLAQRYPSDEKDNRPMPRKKADTLDITLRADQLAEVDDFLEKQAAYLSCGDDPEQLTHAMIEYETAAQAVADILGFIRKAQLEKDRRRAHFTRQLGAQ